MRPRNPTRTTRGRSIKPCSPIFCPHMASPTSLHHRASDHTERWFSSGPRWGFDWITSPVEPNNNAYARFRPLILASWQQSNSRSMRECLFCSSTDIRLHAGATSQYHVGSPNTTVTSYSIGSRPLFDATKESRKRPADGDTNGHIEMVCNAPTRNEKHDPLPILTLQKPQHALTASKRACRAAGAQPQIWFPTAANWSGG